MRTLALVLVSACATTGGDAGSAVVNTAVAVSVAAKRRANGECYTPCTPGTACNATTGLCDPLPCRGECTLGERCEVIATGERCVPAPAALDPALSVHGLATGPTSSPDAGSADTPRNVPRLQLPR
jgi:hypothetical protein